MSSQYGELIASVRHKLTSKLEPEHLEIIDDSSIGCGAKFEAIIVSKKFEGLSLLKQQRLVNDAIAEEMKDIHAFSMKTFTPADYKNYSASTS